MHMIEKCGKFLGYDSTGKPEWKTDRLDGTRFDSTQQANEIFETGCVERSILINIVSIGIDGHYEFYHEYEIQVYKDTVAGKPWRYRIGQIGDDNSRAFEYIHSEHGFTSHEWAIKNAQSHIDQRRITLNQNI